MTHPLSPTTADPPDALQADDDDTPACDAPSLLSLLEQQHAIYTQLQRISGELGQLIVAADAVPVLTLLQRRRPMIERLHAIHSALAPYRPQWRHWLDAMPPGEGRRAAALADEAEAMRLAVLERDAVDARALQTLHTALGDELSRLSKGGRALAAYRAAPAENPSRFTDRQG
jgi:hypothetical protein